MSTIDVHALAGAYALDALDDIERAAFGRHIAQCDACATEVAELHETAARLADLNWTIPPARLKTAVLAEISRTRQAGPTGADRVTGARIGARRWQRWAAAAVAAGVIAAGSAAVTYAVQDQRVRQEQARADRMQAVLTAPDAQLRVANVQGGQVSVVSSASHNAAVVLVRGLPAPSTSQEYELWVIKGTRQVAAGLLGPGTGDGARLVDGVNGADLLGVTLEPAGGSPIPTQPMVTSIAMK